MGRLQGQTQCDSPVIHWEGLCPREICRCIVLVGACFSPYWVGGARGGVTGGEHWMGGAGGVATSWVGLLWRGSLLTSRPPRTCCLLSQPRCLPVSFQEPFSASAPSRRLLFCHPRPRPSQPPGPGPHDGPAQPAGSEPASPLVSPGELQAPSSLLHPPPSWCPIIFFLPPCSQTPRGLGSRPPAGPADGASPHEE